MNGICLHRHWKNVEDGLRIVAGIVLALRRCEESTCNVIVILDIQVVGWTRDKRRALAAKHPAC